MQNQIIKKNGQSELFEPEKLCQSIIKVGASKKLAEQVCGIVSDSVDAEVSSEDIFRLTHQYLIDIDPKIGALYSLERGLSALGPSGFLFEQYVGEIFKIMGYSVTTNIFMQGEGVTHEIDVYAEKGNLGFIIEAKYRNDFKSKTHIDQIMYADARLQDIKRRALKDGDTKEYYMWLITNTEFTDAAISYVQFRDLQLMGWSFPRYINLMKIVSERKVYPVTVLPSINQHFLNKLAERKEVLVSEISAFSVDELRDRYELSMTLAQKIYKEIQDLLK